MATGVIVGAFRTPIGALNGGLAEVPAPQLAATVIRHALTQLKIGSEEIDEVIFGNVVSAGLGQNPARQAALLAGLPPSCGATTVNKVCGSGLKAVMLADQAIRLGEVRCVVAGGMESMSRAPYLVPRARQGLRLGHAQLLDAVIQDGLSDAYGDRHMGFYGDRCAAEFRISRSEQDDFAVRSYQRALTAQQRGWFTREIVPVEVPTKKGTLLVTEDEEPRRFDEQKMRKLPPAFSENGTVTAGNASKINDGAAAVVVADNHWANQRGLTPIARIVGAATFSQEPEWFTIAPVGAVRRLLERVGWRVDDVDLFEINEAFAVVALVALRQLGIPSDRLNVWGGAVALGHPIGCSGTRILVTLLSAMQQQQARRGVAALCIGGGEAVAMAVERA